MLSTLALLSCLLLSLTWPARVKSMGAGRLAELRKSTVEVFQHGFNNYMQHAFPEDELRPVSCTPLSRDPANPGNYDLNDVLGNYSLTLLDSLSTLAILAGTPSDDQTAEWALKEFQGGVEKFVHYYGDGRRGPSGQGIRARGFDLDSKVQVFETVIRGVGGLLSAHLFAVGELPIPGYDPEHAGLNDDDDDDSDLLELAPIPWPSGFHYDGQLLRLALDMAERLLPAFYTTTGLPYPRVNLRHGIPFYINSPLHKVSPNDPDSTQKYPEKTDTCAAGAGSLVLEFTVLSRLTGDQRFEHLAKRAFWAVWKGKSEIGLVGNAIDPERGDWVNFDTGIGAGVDSFFEYALKSHILLSGHDLPNEHTAGAFLEAWHQAHAAIKRHLYNDAHHPYYMTGHRTRGYPFTAWIDSLAAFYPGLLAMAGEVAEGEEANLLYTALWTRYGALPERWSVRERQVDSGIGWWPGRPEFIESTYYLYRATGDPWYLHVGEMVLADINRLCRTKCGWSGLQNVDTGEKADRMQSFFLGETTKYLYVLFDPEHPLNKLDAAFVFSTEAHPLIIPGQRASRRGQKTRKKKKPQVNRLVKGVKAYHDEHYTNTCPVASRPPLTGSAMAARADVFQAASFVNLHTVANPHSGMKLVPTFKGSNETVLRYKENHTFFPWTLPTSMVPDNGTCAALTFKPTLVIEFPSTNQQGSALNQLFANTAAFKTLYGAKITSLNGLKITFIKEESFAPNYDHTWRVTHVNHIALGKDEIVHIDGDMLSDIKDPLFNRVRYTPYVDLMIIYGEPPSENTTAETPLETVEVALDEHGNEIHLSEEASSWLERDAEAPDSLDPSYGSMLKSLVRAVTSVFDPANTPSPDDGPAGASRRTLHMETYKAALPVGIGTVPLPDVRDAPLAPATAPDENTPAAQLHLPWHTLANIPAVTPTAHSLRLVVVDEQRTPGGMPRHRPLSLVMIRGGQTAWEQLGRARGVGVRRKYVIETQGRRVDNIIVL
ncbi:hypothetical protein VdG1_02520 [Verticillium dahliae VDG1]|nr:hypothetical protein VdG1_02520 [Verticillium dahliae VDG1]